MKSIFKTKLLFFLTISLLIVSCVPQRKFEEVLSQKDRCEEERSALRSENESLTTSNNEMEQRISQLESIKANLVRDTTVKGNAYRSLTNQYDKINELNEQLLANEQRLRAGADAETQKTMALLQKTRKELQEKEDELRELEDRLNEERGSLEALQIKLEMQEAAIAEKSAQVMELQSILDAQDSVMNELRKTVAAALVGFEGEGLEVSMREGKVYVSLDEDLMFQSGRWDVDAKGRQALIDLARVLETEEDINIMIEGHTDNLAFRGRGNVEDNWDLSVKRATSIVKLILENSNIDPTRLTAAGRGEYLPIASNETHESRAKNRRTEIILTPNLDILYEIMEKK